MQNPSFDRARSILDKSHYCIIAGIPGIGKTALAEVLLADLVDRHGFEAIRVAQDLSEIRPVKNLKRKQVFYFDDFLGKTALAKLQKNEDQRLIELMEEVAANPNWRFILTTREYILNSAKMYYEAFAHPTIDFPLCTINLEDYTRPIRARILYNHIYFSSLPTTHKMALLENRSYDSILRHRNYNPRVIEYMTQSSHACSVPASLYVSEFVNSLDHPARIWDHAFRHQISEASRHLLLALSTLPDDALLGDVELAFWDLYRFRRGRFGFSTHSTDWDDALRQLDGNFIDTKRIGRDIVVSFHSPSIRDFMADFLSGSDADVADLIDSAHFYEQLVYLWEGRSGGRYGGVDRNFDKFIGSFERQFFGPSASIIRVVSSTGSAIGVDNRPPSYESRTEFAVRVARQVDSAAANRLVNELLYKLEQEWRTGKADREDLVRLLSTLKAARRLTRKDALFKAARQCLTSNPSSIGDFRAISEFTRAYRRALRPAELEDLRGRFMQFAHEYSSQWRHDEDPDWLRHVAADLELVAGRLNVDVENFTATLCASADEIEERRAASQPEEDDREQWDLSSRDLQREDIDAMFNSLRADFSD